MAGECCWHLRLLSEVVGWPRVKLVGLNFGLHSEEEFFAGSSEQELEMPSCSVR